MQLLQLFLLAEVQLTSPNQWRHRTTGGPWTCWYSGP